MAMSISTESTSSSVPGAEGGPTDCGGGQTLLVGETRPFVSASVTSGDHATGTDLAISGTRNLTNTYDLLARSPSRHRVSASVTSGDHAIGTDLAISGTRNLTNTYDLLARSSSHPPGGNVPTPGSNMPGASPIQVPKQFANRLNSNRRKQRTTYASFPCSDPPPGLPSDLNFPLFFTLRSSSSTTHLSDHSFLTLSEDLMKILGVEYPPVTVMRNGSLLIRASTRSQSSTLSSLSSLGGIPLISTPDEQRNTSQGTIYAEDYKKDSEQNLLEWLQRRRVPVTKVYRFPSNRDNLTSPNPRLLLTFSTPYPPTEIFLGFHNYKIRHYVPRPRRCFKCQKFGHPKKYCRGTRDICPRCSADYHTPCEAEFLCPNCKGGHSAASVHCPFYLEEQAILELVTKQKLSRMDARKRLREQQQSLPQSYAAAVSHSNRQPTQAPPSDPSRRGPRLGSHRPANVRPPAGEPTPVGIALCPPTSPVLPSAAPIRIGTTSSNAMESTNTGVTDFSSRSLAPPSASRKRNASGSPKKSFSPHKLSFTSHTQPKHAHEATAAASTIDGGFPMSKAPKDTALTTQKRPKRAPQDTAVDSSSSLSESMHITDSKSSAVPVTPPRRGFQVLADQMDYVSDTSDPETLNSDSGLRLSPEWMTARSRRKRQSIHRKPGSPKPPPTEPATSSTILSTPHTLPSPPSVPPGNLPLLAAPKFVPHTPSVDVQESPHHTPSEPALVDDSRSSLAAPMSLSQEVAGAHHPFDPGRVKGAASPPPPYTTLSTGSADVADPLIRDLKRILGEPDSPAQETFVPPTRNRHLSVLYDFPMPPGHPPPSRNDPRSRRPSLQSNDDESPSHIETIISDRPVPHL